MSHRLPASGCQREGLGRALVACLFLAVGLAVLAAGSASEEFRFAKWNGTYPDLVGDLAPVEQGALVLDLESPSNVVRLRSHRLVLTPLEEGTHRALLEVELQGGGDLVGDLSLGGITRPIDDRVVVPPQRLSIPGRVRIAPSTEGFDVTPVELPRTLTVSVQSQLGNQLLGLCEQVALFLIAGDCASLAESTQKVTVDLPPPGETYVVPSALVTPEERTALLRYLERSQELGR